MSTEADLPGAAGAAEIEPDVGDVEDGQTSLSALRDNIIRKGQNSYYYAHGSTSSAPSWDGNPAPRLIAKEEAVIRENRKETISQYAWMDDGRKVKLYVDFEAANEVDDNRITLDHTSTSLTFVIRNCGSTGTIDRLLSIPELSDEIDSASFSKKATKFIVTMVKSKDFKWYQLKKP